MRVLELGVLAYLATSVSGLTVGRNHLVAARADSVPSSTVPPSSSPTNDAWKSLQCSQVQGDPEAQWKAAGAKSAWDTTISAWKQNPSGGLSQYFSSYLHGPQYMRCSDIATENRCSQPVECQDATIPAGSLILNGFAGIHQLHASAFQAIGNVQADVSNNIGSFTSTFSPQPVDKGALLKNIFDSMALVIGLGSSVVFNVALKQMENVIVKAIMADTLAAGMSAVGSFYKTNMKGAIEGLQVQNTIDSFLGETMNTWKGIESSYLESLFSKSNPDTDTLYTMINNGAMGAIMDALDLNSTSNDVKKILYGQMIPFAWSVSQDQARPFIWRSDDSCDETTKSIPRSAGDLIGDPTLPAKINVCYDGKLHYLLNGHGKDSYMLSALPGGDHLTLDGTEWGGIIIEDIIESSVSGWAKHGNQNGYPRPDVNSVVTTFGGDVPSVRTPGFFNLPVCTDVSVIRETLKHGDGNSPYWPCANPEGYTKSGTDIHVKKGCIVINDAKRCETWGGPYNVADQNQADSNATIYSKFDGDNTLDAKVTPGCKLMAKWPRGYGDLDFEDDCLKDHNNKYSVCCTDQTINTDIVINPYAI
ncbi:hypothetical protein N7463_004694 [Penicillium fimorum]|uniref:Uncharacterized protein n=1 Tax=Penicillium fimorum TaxID=1882269 RepID=A0A9W9Y3G0_9EURO|nr:hypothetical protein N7463_004694 [Penicillium fimorum]